MNHVVYFFGSGLAFFVGVLVLLAGVAVADRSRLRSRLHAFVGAALVALSAAPLPVWWYALAAGAVVGWLVAEGTKRVSVARQRRLVRLAVVAVLLGGWGTEFSYRLVDWPRRVPARWLTVVGDSVSAGTGEPGVQPWPWVYAEAEGVSIDDRSRVGATVASALKRVTAEPVKDGVVLLEIGGNDLLGGTPAADFDRDLDALLAAVSGPGRSVVMFELPLPPLANEYGRVQRRLAAKYGAVLVPRRVFAAVITADGATTDGIHLTAAGHERMATEVYHLLRPAFLPP